MAIRDAGHLPAGVDHIKHYDTNGRSDGHDIEQIDKAVQEAKKCKGKPTVIIAKTVKGKGVSFMENKVGWHGKAPNEDEYKQAIADLSANEN